MDEYAIMYTAIGCLVGLVAAAWLYALGGRQHKLWRRLVSALILALTLNTGALIMGIWSAKLLITLPLLFGGFSMGYGADSTGGKILRRSLYALAILMSGGICVWTFGGDAWMVLVLHIGVAVWSIWLGVKNPIYAAAEEVFICVLLNLGLVMYPFLKV